MFLFADDSGAGVSPWWVAAAMGVLGFVSSAGTVYFFLKDKRRKDADAEDQQYEAKEVRRSRTASAEAWQVVDQLKDELRDYRVKFDELERKCDAAERSVADCKADHAATYTMLKFVVAWAIKQKNPIPLPDDLLDKLKATQPGSAAHATLPKEEGGP